MDSLIDFIAEHTIAGGLTMYQNKAIEALWNEYKLPALTNDFPISIVDADFGRLGSIQIFDISSFHDPVTFAYDGGSYDYVDISPCRIKKILWTDYSPEEPYNRQSGLYCGGVAFNMLKLEAEHKYYREFSFYRENSLNYNLSTAVWGYRYNSFYHSVRFGMCIKTEDVDVFIDKMRELLDK